MLFSLTTIIPTLRSCRGPLWRASYLVSLSGRRHFNERSADNGAYMGTSLPSALRHLELEYMEQWELRKHFDKFDKDGNGAIDRVEAHELLSSAGLTPTQEQVSSTISSMDLDGDGLIQWEEFRQAVESAAEPVSPHVRPISSTMMLSMIGQSVAGTLIPLIALNLGLSTAQIGLIQSASFFSRILCNVPTTVWATKVGRRPLLIAGPAVGALGMFLIGFSTTLPQLVLCNTMNGAAVAMIMSTSAFYMSDISTPRNRARTAAPIFTSGLIGFAVGPIVGGYITEVAGHHVPFLACASALALASLNSLLFLPETLSERNRPQTMDFRSISAKWSALLQQPLPQGLYTLIAFVGFTQGALPVTAVVHAYNTLGMSPLHLGAVCTSCVLAVVLTLQPISALSDRLGRQRHLLIIPGSAGIAISLLLQAVHSSQELFAVIALMGTLSLSVVISNIPPVILDYVQSSERAQALALRSMVQDVGAFVGAALMGVTATYIGLPAAMVTTAGLQGAATLFFARRALAREKKPS